MHPDRRRPCNLRCRLDSCGQLENGVSNICFGPGEYLNPRTPRSNAPAEANWQAYLTSLEGQPINLDGLCVKDPNIVDEQRV